MLKVNIKPLSVNKAWQGKRFKTKDYKDFEIEFMSKLKPMKMPKPPYHVFYEFGVSNSASDYDNPIKVTQDVLQKKYNFDDKNIYEAFIRKVKVKKGDEYIKFELKTIN